ncbi:MAG: glutamate decarboxylase [Bacteroidales bacterium]|nr:glutamate decarboxylase [Bacteroidales bacterium]MBQ8500401.1 glutamate decarboxylase [Bacteroidales bacterium]
MKADGKTRKDETDIIFGSSEMREPAPSEFIPKHRTPAEIAYQMVKDETFPQTQPRLNLATFVTTYMDDYGTRLMNEAVGINYIDETEYPRVAVMCGRCINMVANMWNTPEKNEWKTGAVGIGSSEACMLGGVAAWLRWRARRKKEGKPFDKPNLVMSTAYQVVWEKFCQLWQIEMRTVPVTYEHPTLDIEAVIRMCDENTICIVPIAGVTWTGMNDDIEALDKALEEYNAKTGYDIPIHVDAASGGFILPFLNPEKKWDFRLKNVLSISTSGHKYGLVYPGLGWVVWRDKKYLPEEMSFSVNYLGASITQVGLNFSRPAAQILAQYYNFIHLGEEGYREIHSNSMAIAEYCHQKIGSMPCFDVYSKTLDNPLFIWMMNPEYEEKAKWTLFDLQDKLMQSGWMVPAYTMPKDIEDMVVMRIVVRQGMSRDMADMLIDDIAGAVGELEKLEYPTPSRLKMDKGEKHKGHVYTH